MKTIEEIQKEIEMKNKMETNGKKEELEKPKSSK